MAEGNFATQRLLIVDDEPLIRWSLRERLLGAGYKVVEARDAQCALVSFRDSQPPVDLVLLDLRLPDLDGVAVLRQIKSVRPNCPVIMMTAFGTPERTNEALTSGAYRVVDKPFSLDDMAGLVDEALASAKS